MVTGRLGRKNPGLRKFTLRSTYGSQLLWERVECLSVCEVSDEPPSTASIGCLSGEEDETSLPATTTTILLSKWGQKNITRKECARYFVHGVQLPLHPKSGPFLSFSSPSQSPNSSLFVSTGRMGWQTASGALGKIKMHRRRLSSASVVTSVPSENVAAEEELVMDMGCSASVSRSASLKWSSGWKRRGNRRRE